MMGILAILIFPTVISRQELGWYRMVLVDLPLFFSATAVVSRFYIHSQKEIYSDWKNRLKYIPWCLAFGMGISLNNGRAVVEGLIGHESPFNRTPKFNVVSKQDRWFGKRYGIKKSFISYLELAAGLYFIGVMYFCIAAHIFFPLPFLLLFCSGFLFVGGMSFIQGLSDKVGPASPPERGLS